MTYDTSIFKKVLRAAVSDEGQVCIIPEMEADTKLPLSSQAGILIGILDWLVGSHPEEVQNQVEQFLFEKFEQAREDRFDYITRQKQE